MLVVGHRGASGYLPEHTLAAEQLAIEQCADFIEPDLVSTTDGVLVARHEKGSMVRVPPRRPLPGPAGGGVHPELRGLLPPGADRDDAAPACAAGELRGGRPADFTASGDDRTYADLVTPEGIAFVATYADGIGACKDVLVRRNPDGSLGEPSPVIADALHAGLLVHGWTFRGENRFLPADHRSGPDPNAPGDMAGEAAVFLAAGVDGFLTDNPDLGAEAAEAFGS